MQLTQELFAIPSNDGNVILYAPLDDVILKVNQALAFQLQEIQLGKSDCSSLDQTIREILVNHRILVEEQTPRKKPEIFGEYKPTEVVLMPTFDCNLRCIYCYAEGGLNPGKDLEWDIAQTAIDLVLKNAEEKNKKTNLIFHGGGEPFQKIDFVKKATDYFRNQAEKKDLKYGVSSVTNGIISIPNLEWITQNFDFLNISFDGPEDIQNKQRPCINGEPSFDLVMRTIMYLEEVKFKYLIRSIITSESVHRMMEIIDFLHLITALRKFHLEPLYECGRCLISQAKAPSPEDFLRNAVKTRKRANELGLRLILSYPILGHIQYFYCGAAGSNFIVTPNGDVTSCTDVSRENHPHKDIFFIGKFDSTNKKFTFYPEKIKTLRRRTIDSIPTCSNCFAKYNCGGECFQRVYSQSGSLIDTSNNPRCTINRGLLMDEMENKLMGVKTNETMF